MYFSTRPPLEKIGPLEAIRIPGDSSGPCIILFHGYGADAYDLAPMAGEMKVPKGTTWIFPNGPLRVALGPGFEGSAWFPIDMRALEEAMMRGTHRDFSRQIPPGMEESRRMAEAMIKELKIPFSKIILGGFSQGAMIATDITLRSDESPAGLAILSGTLLAKDEWQELAPKRKGLSFFQSHGTHDPLLGYGQAEQLEQLLVKSGLKGQLMTFGGGHEIPMDVMGSLERYVLEQLG